MNKLTRITLNVIKITGIVIFLMLFALGVYLFTYEEDRPYHPLDFSDTEEKVIEEQINSVAEALPHAISQVHEWREDAKLVKVELILEEQKQIENTLGKIIFKFEFPFIDDHQPSGLAYVTVYNNKIERVSVAHGRDKVKEIPELKLSDLPLNFKEICELAINHIGKDNFLKIQEPIVRLSVDTSGYSKVTINRFPGHDIVMIDMKTGEIIESIIE